MGYWGWPGFHGMSYFFPGILEQVNRVAGLRSEESRLQVESLSGDLWCVTFAMAST